MRINKHTALTLIILAIAAIIPILPTIGKLTIGGDVIIPIIPEFARARIYQWVDVSNGLYAANDFITWISIFRVLTHIGFSIYTSGFLLQFSIFFLSALGIYKIYTLFSKNNFFALLAASSFMYSPYLLDHMVYFYPTTASIWIFYFFFKSIKNKQFAFSSIFYISVLIWFLGNLPNPKYHFLVALICVTSILLGLAFKILSISDLRRNTPRFLLLLAMTAYLWIPVLYFAKSYTQNTTINVQIKQNYQSTGVAIDFGSTLINKMIKLFHSPNLNPSDATIINSVPTSYVYFVLPLIVLYVFPFIYLKKNDKKIFCIFYILTIFLIFLTKSSNPPFGFLYETLLTSSKLFAFLRTTAGIVIYAGIFYSLLFARTIELLTETFGYKRSLSAAAALFIIMIGFPIWSGKYFLNHLTHLNKYINNTHFGTDIPEDYFKTAYELKKIELDTKVDIYPVAEGYQSNTWGYFGFIIYPWIYDKASIGFNKKTLEGMIQSQTNTKYIVHDKSIIDEKQSAIPLTNFQIEPIMDTNLISIYSKPNKSYIPHIYTPQHIMYLNRMFYTALSKQNELPVAIYNIKDLTHISNSNIPTELIQPIVEYKKINATKYRVRIHQATKSFPIIFTDNYDKDWKVYTVPYRAGLKPEFDELQYHIFEKNEREQASVDEVHDMIARGFISTLGTMKKREKKYYRFLSRDQKEIYNDAYYIDFISKNIKNTIQNNNLENGPFFETWFLKSIDTRNHLRVNDYANSWLLDIESVCQSAACQLNDDGSYDIELVLEFFPQKLFYICFTFSVLAGCIGYIILHRKK